MPRHYHLIAAAQGGPPFAQAEFETYEESIRKFTIMSTELFGHLFDGEDKITLERVMEETEFGEGKPIVVGTPRLCLYWFPCEKCEPLVSN